MFCLTRVFRSINIPKDRVQLLYSRASGPGGQNIAASNSKVQLRFEVDSADWLPPEVRGELARRFGRVVVLAAQESRSCKVNEKNCFSKLTELIEKTKAYLSQPRTQYASFDAWLSSVRTDKQISRHKAIREQSKRRDAKLRRDKRPNFDD